MTRALSFRQTDRICQSRILFSKKWPLPPAPRGGRARFRPGRGAGLASLRIGSSPSSRVVPIFAGDPAWAEENGSSAGPGWSSAGRFLPWAGPNKASAGHRLALGWAWNVQRRGNPPQPRPSGGQRRAKMVQPRPFRAQRGGATLQPRGGQGRRFSVAPRRQGFRATTFDSPLLGKPSHLASLGARSSTPGVKRRGLAAARAGRADPFARQARQGLAEKVCPHSCPARSQERPSQRAKRTRGRGREGS